MGDELRRLILLILLLLLLALPVAATEGIEIDTSGVENGLTDEASELMPVREVQNSGSFWTGCKRIICAAFEKSTASLREALRLCAILLAVLLLCAVADLQLFKDGSTAVTVVGALGLTAAILTSFGSMVTMAKETVTALADYGALLLPAMATASAMSGGITSASALYAGTLLFTQLLMRLISSILIPAVYLYLALSLAEAALSNEMLTELRSFVGWLISKSLRILLYVFLGYMSLTGVISGTADAAAVKATKAAVSGMVPVVGSMISDASESILSSALLIKSSVGVFGMLAVISICVVPFLRVGVHYLLLKVTAAVGGTVGMKPHITLLRNFSTAMGYLLAMCGTCALLLFISVVCFLKVAV